VRSVDSVRSAAGQDDRLTPPGEVGSPLPDTGCWPWTTEGRHGPVRRHLQCPSVGVDDLAKVRVAGLSTLVIVHVFLTDGGVEQAVLDDSARCRPGRRRNRSRTRQPELPGQHDRPD
jgi:hypothetical protein